MVFYNMVILWHTSEARLCSLYPSTIHFWTEIFDKPLDLSGNSVIEHEMSSEYAMDKLIGELIYGNFISYNESFIS